jgi:hypothetical protein
MRPLGLLWQHLDNIRRIAKKMAKVEQITYTS